MEWLHTLLSWWASFANLAADWAVRSETWVWPLSILAPFFRGLSSVIDGLFSGFFDFTFWADRVNRDITEMVTQSWVWEFFQDPLAKINEVWAWFSDRWNYILAIVNNWWLGAQAVVLGWVETAKNYALGLVSNLTAVVNGITSAWNNFWTNILPDLASRFTVDDMIKSAFLSWQDELNTLGEFAAGIRTFFTNPVDFIWQRFTGWFFGGD